MGRRRAGFPSAAALAATLACATPAARAAAVPQCPAGSFQDEPIVFGCGASSGTVDFQAAPNGVQTVFSVPPGTSQFQVKMTDPTGSADMADLLVYDVTESRILVGPDKGVITNAKKEGSYNLVFVSYSGSVNTQESVKFVGSTEDIFQVKIKNKGDEALKIKFEYSYSEISNCNGAQPSGCAAYDALRVQRNVVDWSSWLQQEYESAGGVSEAWTSLQQDAKFDATGNIPFYLWADFWALYPLADRESAAPMAIFKYVSADGLSVTQSDFNAAYFAKDRFDATKTCFASLHSQYPYEHDAWAKIQDKSVQTGQTPTDVLLAECGGTPQEQADVRSFLDADKSGVLDFSEFRAAWNTLSTCPAGFYRSSAIIYHCQEFGGLAVVWMPAGETVDISTVPAGVTNMHATIEADVDADLFLLDPVSHEYAIRWDDSSANYSGNNGTYVGTWNGIDIVVGGDSQLTKATGGQEGAEEDEYFVINDTLPSELIFQVKNFAATDAWAYIRYGWDSVEKDSCPKVPVGCKQFCPQRAVECAMKFSDWLHAAYSNASSSWDAVAVPYLTSFGPGANLTGEDAPAQGVLFPQWQLVHRDWPDHGESNDECGDCTWQEGFFFADDDNDGSVTEEEWNRLYNFTEGIERLDGFMCAARRAFPDAGGFMSKLLPAGSVTADRTTFINALNTYYSQGTLPGTASHCEVVPEIPLFAWGRPNMFRIDEVHPETEGATADVGTLPTSIGEAAALGFGTGSWTALARMYRVPYTSTETIPTTNTADNPVYIMSWEGSMDEDNLMLGLQDSHLTMDFSMSVNRVTGTTCRTDEVVPHSEWTDVAYIYDAARKEQRIFLNGRIAKVCSNVEPFTANQRSVYVAEAHGGVSSFAGILSTLYTYTCALAATTISSIFESAPRWQHLSEVFFSNSASGSHAAVPMGPVSLLGVGSGSLSLLAKVRREYQDDVSLYTVMGTSGDPAAGIEIAVDHGHFSFRVGVAACTSPQYVTPDVWTFAAFIYDATRGELQMFQGLSPSDVKLVMSCPNVGPWVPSDEDQALWAGSHGEAEGENASASTGINPWKGTMSRMMLFDRRLCGNHVINTFVEADKWNEITQIAFTGDGMAGGTPATCQAFTGQPTNGAPAPAAQPGGDGAASTQPKSPQCEVVHQDRRLQSIPPVKVRHHSGIQAAAAQAAVAAGMAAMGVVAKKISDGENWMDNFTTSTALPWAPVPAKTTPLWWKLQTPAATTTAAPPTQFHFGGLTAAADPNSIAATLVDRNGDSSIDTQELQAAMDEACHTIDPSIATEPIGGPPVDASGDDIVQKDELSARVRFPAGAPLGVAGSPLTVGSCALVVLSAAALAFAAVRTRQAQVWSYHLHRLPADDDDLLEGGRPHVLEPAE